MQLRQMEHFVAVAEERSFTRAAKRMNIVQSGLSMSIRELENVLGTKLFSRGSKGIELTDAGTALLPEARRVIASMHAAREAVSATLGLSRGALALGIAQYVDGERVPRVLARFHGDYPGVDVRAAQAPPGALIDDLRAGRLDLAICGRLLDMPDDVTTIVLSSAPFVVMCANSHHLAGREHVTLAQVAREPFIELHRGWTTRQHTEQAFEAAGLERRVVCEVNDVLLRLQMVEAGLGLAILPNIKFPGVSNVSFVPLQPPLPDWQLVAAFCGEEPANAAARVFLGMVTREWVLS